MAARVGEEGPAYMFYTGCTIVGTPVSPVADELAPAAAMRAPTEDKKQVLDGLTKRYRDLDAARTAAAATGSLVAVVKAVCEARSERIVTEQELARLDPVKNDLINFARDPFSALPPSYATYVATVPVDKLDEAPAGEPDGLTWYERQITFGGFAELLARLDDAIATFPALIPRLTPVRGAVAARVGEQGPVYMFNSGCTIAGTPVSRATKGPGSAQQLITSLFDLWQVKADVYRVALEPVEIGTFEYRGERQLQLVEHCLISTRFPHNLNSAPGGFAHDYRVDLHPPCPLSESLREPAPAAKFEAVRRHLEGMYAAYASRRPTATTIDPDALAHQVDAATPRFLARGRPLVVAIGKDATREEYNGANPDIGYRQRLSGPGSQATNAALLQQHNVDAAMATLDQKLAILPPFVDLFTDPDFHFWLWSLIFLRRYFSVIGWPSVVWAVSGKVAAAFLDGDLAAVAEIENGQAFNDCREHVPAAPAETAPKKAVKMVDSAGHAVICDLGHGHLAIVLVNYDRGVLKYDPQPADNRRLGAYKRALCGTAIRPPSAPSTSFTTLGRLPFPLICVQSGESCVRGETTQHPIARWIHQVNRGYDPGLRVSRRYQQFHHQRRTARLILKANNNKGTS